MLIGSLSLVSGCSPNPHSISAPEASLSTPKGALHYDVAVGEQARELLVNALIPPGFPEELSVDSGAEPYVRDVELLNEAGSQAVSAYQTSWFPEECARFGCRLRYRFLLEEAARAIGDYEVASAYGGAFLAPPSTWLLHPLDAKAGSEYRFHVEAPKHLEFVTGVFPVPSAPHTYGADASDLPSAPYSAFGVARTHTISVQGAELQAAFLPGDLDAPDSEILSWVEASAKAVAGYYGRFPVKHALILIAPDRGDSPGFATTLGNGGASIVIRVGRHSDRVSLARDWVLTHEMVHTALPNLARRHAWLEEGLATYIEPIARVRAGGLSVQEAWLDLLRGLPKGLPGEGDRGLDFTPTWGRKYWGGALFCLMADMAIRERTNNRRSLGDALIAIVNAGGNVSVSWPIEQVIEVGDRAVGVPVLAELYAQMRASPVQVDLRALWERLGVGFSAGRVVFDDAAPLASIRRSMIEASGK